MPHHHAIQALQYMLSQHCLDHRHGLGVTDVCRLTIQQLLRHLQARSYSYLAGGYILCTACFNDMLRLCWHAL